MKKAVSAVVLFFSVAGAAHAQVDYVGSWIGANDFRRQIERSQDNRDVGKHPKREEADATSAPVIANADAAYLDAMRTLRHEPSTAVTRRVNASMADVLAGQPVQRSSSTIQLLEACFSQHPKFRRLLAAQVGGTPDVMLGALNAGVLQRRFRHRLENYGYSADNIADVSNAFLIDAWAVVNGENVDQAMAFRGLQAELRRMLSDGQTPPPLSAETRQENTEALALLAMLVGAARHNARTPEDQASLRAGVDDIGRRMGIELRQVALTERGFVGR